MHVVVARVTRAPKGSAVFEVVSEEQYSGVVLDRMLAKGSNIASGLVQYELDGVPSKLTYGPKDLQVGCDRFLYYAHAVLPAEDGWQSQTWNRV